MITNIILSKNRGLQLDALLRSLKEYSGDIFDNVVIYTHTDKKYRKGYNIIKKRHRDTKFVFESNLKKDILKHMTSTFTCFMVDDMIMFRHAHEEAFMKHGRCYSFRLGHNIKEPHLSYPLSLDGHMFFTEDIKPLIEGLIFNNPNTLESKLQRFKKDWEIDYNHQCTVSIPHNKVSSKSRCKFSGLYDTKTLNRYLLDDFIIDYNRMDFEGLKNVHATPDYKFKLHE